MFSFRSITCIVHPFLFSHQQTINFLLYPALCFYFFKTVFLLHIRVFGSIYLTHKHPVWSGTCFIRRIQCLINHQLLSALCMSRNGCYLIQSAFKMSVKLSSPDLSHGLHFLPKLLFYYSMFTRKCKFYGLACAVASSSH